MTRPNSKPDPLQARFGGTKYYQDIFKGLTQSHVGDLFESLESHRTKVDQSVYEAGRQEFLKVYGKFKGPWRSTGTSTDHLVEVARLYSHGSQYYAFMRIQPNGFQDERFVPYYMDLRFHLLMGKVIVVYRKRTRTLSRGSHLHVFPKSQISMRSVCPDQEAIFVFKITIDMSRKRFLFQPR